MSSVKEHNVNGDVEVVNMRFFTSLLEEFDRASSCPLRAFCYCMTKEEIEGEACNFLSSFLIEKRCPADLKDALVHACIKQLLERDLNNCVLDGDGDIAQYDAAKVAELAFQIFAEVCRSWNFEKNSSSALKEKGLFHVCSHAIKNGRRKMEDRHIAITDFNTFFGLNMAHYEQAMFCVFDGHGGVDAANYAASQLPCNLKRNELLNTSPVDALRDAFIYTDSQFVKKAKTEKLRCGTTAAVAFIQDRVLHVAWVGDSQIVLSKSGAAIQIMDPHKPDREDERQRIEALGGCVVFFGGWRVNGSLAVSRAIGDYEQKPYISGEPDISSYELEGDEEFLILACDGLWDAVDPQTAVELVHESIKLNERDSAAVVLVEKAVSGRSKDNITVMVVFFDYPQRNGVD